nr:MAG TPA: hypothetical protein [Bacteriophage sp.]
MNKSIKIFLIYTTFCVDIHQYLCYYIYNIRKANKKG